MSISCFRFTMLAPFSRFPRIDQADLEHCSALVVFQFAGVRASCYVRNMNMSKKYVLELILAFHSCPFRPAPSSQQPFDTFLRFILTHIEKTLNLTFRQSDQHVPNNNSTRMFHVPMGIQSLIQTKTWISGRKFNNCHSAQISFLTN